MKGTEHKVLLELNSDDDNNDANNNRYVCSVNFDRSGEALAVGTSDRLLQIYDVERGKQIRNIKGHGARVSSISWNRSVLAPYLITSGG